MCLALQRLAREVGGGRYDPACVRCQGCAWFALGRRGARGFCSPDVTAPIDIVTVPFPPAKPREDVTILAIRYDPPSIISRHLRNVLKCMCYTCK